MTRGEPSRTVSLSIGGSARSTRSDRGQTTQDFAVGIGVFLLAMAFVFSFVPTFVTPFDSAAGSAETAQADRVAATVVDTLTEDPERPNHLNVTKFEEYAALDDGDLATTLGVRSTGGTDGADPVLVDRVNVSIEYVNANGTVVRNESDEPLAAGPIYDEEQAAASVARIVTVGPDRPEPSDEPEPAYRLVVRVW